MPERGSYLLHVMDRITVENLKRSHLQICIWKNALDQDPSNLVCTQYVWGEMPEHKINATSNSARKCLIRKLHFEIDTLHMH